MLNVIYSVEHEDALEDDDSDPNEKGSNRCNIRLRVNFTQVGILFLSLLGDEICATKGNDRWNVIT